MGGGERTREMKEFQSWGSSSPRRAQEGLPVRAARPKASDNRDCWVTASVEYHAHNARGSKVEVWDIWLHFDSNKRHRLLPAKPNATTRAYVQTYPTLQKTGCLPQTQVRVGDRRRTTPSPRSPGGRHLAAPRLHAKARGQRAPPGGWDAPGRKLPSSKHFPSDDRSPAAAQPFRLYPRVGQTNQQVPPRSPRRLPDERGVQPRSASPPPCSPAPRSNPAHPSERQEVRWSGARGPGARSEPWRPPSVGRQERAGVEPGPGSRERRSRLQPGSSLSRAGS